MTPDAYSLTRNALIAACNQTSSRDTVVRYEPQQVGSAVSLLGQKQSLWIQLLEADADTRAAA